MKNLAKIGLVALAGYVLTGCKGVCQESSKNIVQASRGDWIKSGKNTGEDGTTELIEFNLESARPLPNTGNALRNVVIKQTWENKSKQDSQVNLWLATIDCQKKTGWAIVSVGDIHGQALFGQENSPLIGGIYLKGIEAVCTKTLTFN